MMNELPIVKYNDILVVTSNQVAEMYGTNSKVVANGFNRNKRKFTEGKHYFKLTGEELNHFRNSQICVRQNDDNKICSPRIEEHKNLQSDKDGLQISNKARVLYLWTNRGALLLAKIIDTDIAWEAYERLVDFYFDRKEENTLQQITDFPEYRKPIYQTSSTPVPKNPSWYYRNRRRMQDLAVKAKCSNSTVYHCVLKRLSEEYDLDAAKEIYVKELGQPPQYALDIVSYFPELAKLADKYLDWLEELPRKKSE